MEDMLAELAAGSPDRLTLWERIIGRLAPERMLEVGVWRGDFAARVLRTSPSISSYLMIDPWRKLPQWDKPASRDDVTFENIYERAMSNVAFAKDRVTVLRGTTAEMAHDIPDNSLDFIYIDGDHTLRGITIDLLSAWTKLKIGGYMAGDDLSPTIWQHSPVYEPTLVFPFAVYFAEAVGASIFALPFQQFIMQKPVAGARQYRFVDMTGRYRATSLKAQLSLEILVRQRVKALFRRLRRTAPSPGY